jgi:hypothetical protein
MTELSNFVSTIKRNGVAKESHYFCGIEPPRFMAQTATKVLDVIPFYVESVIMPEIALITSTVKDFGLNREAVYDKAYGSTTMTFFSDQNMTVKKFFDDWISRIVYRTGGRFMYPDSYYAETLNLLVNDNTKNATYTIILKNVYPKIVDNMSLRADGKGFLSFRVEFVYDSWESYQISTTDPDAEIPGNPLNNLRRVFNLVNLVRTGMNKDALKSMLINVGTRKITDIIGKSGVVESIAGKADAIVGNTGIGNVLGKIGF